MNFMFTHIHDVYVKNHLITQSIKTSNLINQNTRRQNNASSKLTSLKSTNQSYNSNLENGVAELIEINGLKRAIEYTKESGNDTFKLTEKLKSTEKRFENVKMNVSVKDLLNFEEIIDTQTDLFLFEDVNISLNNHLLKLNSKDYRKQLQKERDKELQNEIKNEEIEKAKSEVKEKRKQAKQKARQASKVAEKEVKKESKEILEKDVTEGEVKPIKSKTKLPHDINHNEEAQKFSEDSAFMAAFNDPNFETWGQSYIDNYKNGNADLNIQPDPIKAKILENKLAEINAINNQEEIETFVESRNEIAKKDTDVEVYTESDQKEVEPTIDELNEELGKTEHYQSEFDENNEVVYEGSRVNSGSNKVAYLSRNYNKVSKVIDGKLIVSKEDKDNLLNDNLFDKSILDPNEFQAGTELTLEVDKNLSYTNDEGEVITYETLRNKEKVQKLDGGLVPIVIKKDGKKIGYLHDVNWIKEENISGDVVSDKRNLMNLRSSIIQANAPVKTTVQSKGFGKLARTAKEEQIDTGVP